MKLIRRVVPLVKNCPKTDTFNISQNLRLKKQGIQVCNMKKGAPSASRKGTRFLEWKKGDRLLSPVRKQGPCLFETIFLIKIVALSSLIYLFIPEYKLRSSK